MVALVPAINHNDKTSGEHQSIRMASPTNKEVLKMAADSWDRRRRNSSIWGACPHLRVDHASILLLTAHLINLQDTARSVRRR